MTAVRRAAFLALATIFAAALVQAQQKPFTLQQVMSAPFPYDLTAAPAGGRVAWVFNAAGARNIWIAEPSTSGAGGFVAKQLTHYTGDDGQDVGQISWAHDGKTLVYTRGGDFDFPDKPYPNPSADVQGVEQDIWAVSIQGGAPVKIAEGHSAAVWPAGNYVAYVYKDQIWYASLDGSGKPRQLIHDIGKARQLRWSPDGSALAFVSHRGNHNLIAVYYLNAERLVFLDPGVDYDMDPTWSPDGSRIAFVRVPAASYRQLDIDVFPHRSGQPWSIDVADASTGKGRAVWTADPGQGSVFRGIAEPNDIFWAAHNLIIFPWEKDGWLHLYSVSADGGHAHLLTPGSFVVENVSLTPDRRELFFNSNQNDIDRRHIWKEAVTASHPVAVTEGKGIEWSPVMPGGSMALFILHSDARRPGWPAVIDASGKVEDLARAVMPADFPAADLVVPKQVIFAAPDGLKIHGQLFLPRNAENGKRHAAIVFFHGGSRRQMLLGWHMMDYYSNAYALNQYFASRGFVVLSVNYRSGIGYGLDFREALKFGATGASEYNDVRAAALFLRTRSDVDAKRIGCWGGSYGGYLTALALARSSDLYAAGVDMAGVHDWNNEFPLWVEGYDPALEKARARLAFESSPLAFIKTWRSPVLLIQGDDDRDVPFEETVQMTEALRRQGVDFKLLVIPDEVHVLLRHASWLEAYRAAAAFFAQHLGQ